MPGSDGALMHTYITTKTTRKRCVTDRSAEMERAPLVNWRHVAGRFVGGDFVFVLERQRDVV